MNSSMLRSPEFIIFTGPMFGSKTTRLLAAVDRYKRQQRRVIAFKPMMDDRYIKSKIKTHNGGTLGAYVVSSGEQLLQVFNEHVSNESQVVVAVDEAFMIDGVAMASLDIFKRGHTVIVSSIQLSSTGRPFEEVKDMMPFATKIEVCPAVCPVSGKDAYYTYRKSDVIDEIAVGGPEMYEPRAWYHFPPIRQEEI